MSELRLAVRTFVRRPALSLAIVIALAVGLAAAVAALSLVQRVIVEPPPLPDPGRLVVIAEADRRTPDKEAQVPPADVLDFQRSGAFEALGAWMKWNLTLTGTPMPQRLPTALVSGSYFPTLAKLPALGRTILPSDAVQGHDDVVVISDRLWRSAFHADPAIVGKRVTLNGEADTVVGVMPAGFRHPDDDVDVWVPFVFGVQFPTDDRAGRNLRVIARLRQGVSLEQAKAQLNAVMARAAVSSPKTHEGWTARISTLQAAETKAIRPTVMMLLCAAAAMLAVAVANVANLFLMLAAARARELATRLALGAPRRALVARATAEGMVVGLLTGTIALMLASSLLTILAHLGGDVLRAESFALTPAVAALGMAVALLVGVSASVGAMLVFSRGDMTTAIRASSHQLASGRLRFRNALVIAQIAFTTAILIPAALLVRSLDRLSAVDPGFKAHRLLTAQVWLPSRYKEPARQRAFFRDALERLRALPGVGAAATIQDLPLRRNAMTFDIAIDDGTSPRAGSAAYRVVSDGYFQVMSIPLLRGRAFTAADDEQAAHVVVINRALAARSFGGVDPLGKRLRIGGEGEWATVVGIAGDVQQMGLAGGEVPAVYQPYAQKQFDFLRWSTLVLRITTEASPQLAAALRREILRIDPDQPLADIRTVDEIVAGELARPRLAASVTGYLGVVALLVAIIGIAGVLSYAVALRGRELGIRAALGAAPAALRTLILRHAATLAIAGIAAGIATTAAVAPLLDRLLFGVTALDPSVYAAVSATLLATALAAALLPARRAARVDPARMLRAE
jgi:predicted permease